MPRIAVDALGGDRGPEEVVAGAVQAAADGIDVLIVGPPGLETGGLPLREALEVIEMADKPTDAVRSKPDSTLVSAIRAVAEGEADAIVSAGNTGAVLAAGLLHLRRLPGVLRPAIAVSLPARDGPSVLLDAGANADARAEHLLQFAHMGAVFCEEILDIENPSVRLLSIGEEDEKGSALVLDAHALLRESSLNFAGNAESRDLLKGAADVIVTDGFTGNIALKLLEGTIREVLDALREEITATASGKLGGLLIKPAATAPAHAARPRHARRRLPPRAEGFGRDRAWEFECQSSRQRNPPGGPRRRSSGGRTACRKASAASRCMIARFYPSPREPMR